MAKGINVGAWDPHLEISDFPEGIDVIDRVEDAIGYDIAVLITAHKACIEIDWQELLENMRTPIVYDGRRVLDLEYLNQMGWETHAVGKPTNY